MMAFLTVAVLLAVVRLVDHRLLAVFSLLAGDCWLHFLAVLMGLPVFCSFSVPLVGVLAVFSGCLAAVLCGVPSLATVLP